MMSNETTELLHVGDILWNEPCDERIVVVAANERNVWLRKVQKNDELAMHDGHVWSMLGKKCNVKNMCTQSYAQSVFELDGHVEQAIADELNELGSGTCEIDYERHCSNCGVYVHDDAVLVRKDLDGGTWTVVPKPVNYCPNCGAKVIGG